MLYNIIISNRKRNQNDIDIARENTGKNVFQVPVLSLL